eukprot:3359760-Lingulodinium_polyedra.AAC.1
MATQQRHPQSLRAAWALLHSSTARAFDYDARLVGAARLEPVVGPVYRQLVGAVAAIAGELGETARGRLKLAGSYG